MQIRDAVQSDLEQITAIYNEVLTNSTAIYNDRPATVDERISWWRSRIAQGYPVVVTADGAHIAGFGSFGDFRAWPGYRFTVEGTVHIHAGSRGQRCGHGTAEGDPEPRQGCGQTHHDGRRGLRECRVTAVPGALRI